MGQQQNEPLNFKKGNNKVDANKIDIKMLKLQIIMKILRENPISKMYQNEENLIAVLQDLNKQLSQDVTLMFNVDQKREHGQTQKLE